MISRMKRTQTGVGNVEVTLMGDCSVDTELYMGRGCDCIEVEFVESRRQSCRAVEDYLQAQARSHSHRANLFGMGSHKCGP